MVDSEREVAYYFYLLYAGQTAVWYHESNWHTTLALVYDTKQEYTGERRYLPMK